jgi:hypothetical protein
MAETVGLKNYVFYYRHKIFHLGKHSNNDSNSMFAMQYRCAIYRKIGNEFSDAVFYNSDNSD